MIVHTHQICEELLLVFVLFGALGHVNAFTNFVDIFCRYVDLRACITWLPENGYGANLTTWPARLHHPPDRLWSIKMDADISRKEIFRAESKYWNDIIDSYVRAFRWKEMNLRNVMDMRAGFGGYHLFSMTISDIPFSEEIIQLFLKCILTLLNSIQGIEPMLWC